MTENLEKYLKDNLWTKYGSYDKYFDFWILETCSECYSQITESLVTGIFVYSRDCPDIWKKLEDFPPDILFDSEEKLIEFLEKKKLTKWSPVV
jgi:hypothetical protein